MNPLHSVVSSRAPCCPVTEADADPVGWAEVDPVAPALVVSEMKLPILTLVGCQYGKRI